MMNNLACSTYVDYAFSVFFTHMQGITAQPLNEEDLFQWEASITGLSGTPWEGGIFRLSLSFSQEYNTCPPQLWFTTVPFHPNSKCCGLYYPI